MVVLDQVRRVWGRLAPRSGRSLTASVAEESTSIEDLQASLHAFGQESDHEFTAIAKGISLLLQNMNKVAEQTAVLDAVMQDNDEKHTLSRAYAVYKQSVDLVHASMGVALADHEHLESVERKLLSACDSRQDLGQSSVYFRILTVETRMEAARLGADARGVFETVAHAIDAMGKSINDTATDALGRIEQVVSETRAERSQLYSHQLSLHTEAQQSVQRIRSELDALREALVPCIARSQAVLSAVDALKQSANQAVIALQGQDIVRQQLEHVSEGFGDIGKLADDPAARAQAARVQHGQLLAAKARILDSSVRLTNALEVIVTTGNQVASEYSQMEEQAGAALSHCNLASLFKEETERLALIAEQSEQSNRRIGELVNRVDDVIKAFSKQVGEQQFDVKIVALNAQIAAARLAQAGGLNRLAQETSHVSDQVGRMTQAMTQRLIEAVAMLREIKAEADRFQEVILKDKQGLEEQSAEVNGMLGVFIQRIQSESRQVSREFAEINESVRQLRDAFAVETQVGVCFDPCTEFCEREAAKGAIVGIDPNHTYTIKQGRYTMQSEVEVHQKVIGAAGVAGVAGAAGETSSPPPSQEDKDIELF